MRISLARIAPVEPQQEQVNGEGWAWRYKVRIFDKHTEDKNILPDEDLPWAQVLLPVTAGSGAANFAVSPSINQGDTVSVMYYDDDEQMPIITGVLPRTDVVSNSEPDERGGYIPHSGFTENRPKSSKTDDGEGNESNKDSQKSTRSDKFWGGIGDTAVLANTCDPNEYKVSAVTAEINNLINQVQAFIDDATRVESMIVGAIDRIHALVNPYVGEMFNQVFEALVPILNSGLSALYKAIYAKVLAATQNPTAARLAAEAALLALVPPILALQEAIQLLAAKVVDELLDKVEALVRDTVEYNDRFNSCAGTQFNGALVNSIIGDIDSGLDPLLDAVAKILSGGFNTVSTIRSSLEYLKDITGAFLSAGQGGNKCGGLVKEYAFGIGEKASVGDVLDEVLEAANKAAAVVDGGSEELDDLLKTFGDFPFISPSSGELTGLESCSNEPETVCFGPEVLIFGGRGGGAVARAIVGDYVPSTDPRIVGNVQGGVLSVEVVDGGSDYTYPPFVEIKDNCGLGIGAVARSVLGKKGTENEGKVEKIYIVDPGQLYPSDSEEELFYVESVEVVAGGSGYRDGFVTDNYGGEYQVVTDGGRVTEVLPTNLIQVPTIPTIRIPDISPPIPPGGNIATIDGVQYVVNKNGNIIGELEKGNGLNIKVILQRLPRADAIINGEITEDLQGRLSQRTLQEIIDCIQN